MNSGRCTRLVGKYLRLERSKPAISTTPGEILEQERLGKRLEREVKVLAVV